MSKVTYKDYLTDDGLKRLESWARDGLTNAQIAKNAGVNVSTLQAWIKAHDDISDALKRGKLPIDFEVENALLKRALGYTYQEVTKERFVNKLTGEEELLVTKSVSKEALPDVTAQIYWLKNRKPELWQVLSPKISLKMSKELEKLTYETQLLEHEAKKLEEGGQNNALLEALVKVVEEDGKKK